ncbi:MAG TPA: hypothetical protein VNO82_01240 [Solirubrobacteraceae bacterium]|nr:hypothetical protein [Solirubrobacteraceae bacterium]
MLARVLLFLASLFIVLAVTAGYVRFELLDQDHFSSRAASALENPDVRAVLGREITDRVVLRTEPDLVAAKPLIEAAVAGIAGSEPFRALFEDGIRRLHSALLSGNSRVSLDLRDAGVLVESAIGRLPVRGLDNIQRDVAVQLGFVNEVTTTATETAEKLRIATWALIVAALLLATGGLVLSADWRHALQVLGFSVTGMAVAAATVLAVARIALIRLASDREVDRQAAGAVWDAFLGDLIGLLLLVAAFATMVAAAVATRASLPSLVPALADGWRVASRTPRRPVWRIARALGLVIAGGLIVAEPLGALRVLAIVAGLFVLYVGVAELLGVARARRAARAEIGRRDIAAALAPAGIGVIAVGCLLLFLSSGGATAPAVVRTAACNGHVELCSRTLDEVAMPATHNSMSTSADGWFSSIQTLSIRDQLRAGVRGLLIDAHYGLRVGDDVRTDLSERSERAANPDRELYLELVGPEGLAAIQRIRDRILPGEGEPGVFLCHRFCELGATEITRALRDVRDFLVERPDEVIVIVIEDYVLPSAIVEAFARSGLSENVYRGPPAGPFPTLREMIDSGQQVVVYAERVGGAAPWYTAGYERAIQETPFTFKQAARLTQPAAWPASCAPNRGTDDAPLMLMNHWVNTDPTPRPSNAAIVNTPPVLTGRAGECERLRQDVNLLAIDFVGEGDVVAAADELNGVPR